MANHLVLYGHNGYETYGNLSEALERELGDRFSENLDDFENRDTILARWGTGREEGIDMAPFSRVLNKGRSINRNVNKLLSLKIMKAARISVPDFFERKEDITSFPVLGRDSHHHGGTDVVIINGSNMSPIWRYNRLSNIPNKNFYTKIIQSREEFRVHVFLGNVIRVTKKVYRGQTRNGEIVEAKSIIRNDTYGWGHANVDIANLPRTHVDISIAALRALDLDFGAVDLIVDLSGRPYILEVNTAPHLNEVGIDIYVQQFSKLIRSKLDIKNKLKFWS